ncbi:MAG: 16S rRNA (adenine(1518)-N(6)/adenine(1519)-N(6))-dimethyltransferase RsmA [Myxococcota bacterium]
MTDPSRAKEVLAGLEQRARRRFGQHFLTDTGIVDRIVRGARVGPGDPVIEIGPGLGVLTSALLATGARVSAIELDRDLAAYIRATYPAVELIEADALKVDWAEVCRGGGYKVVANLPYNVGTTVTMQLVRRPELFRSITVMLQLEVVQRMCAEPGSKTFGALSVELQARAQTTFLLKVPSDRFHPRPKVESAVLRIEPYAEARTGGATPAQFDQVVRAAFSQRRKTLLNAVGARFGREIAAAALARAGVDSGLRAEQLGLDEFRAVAAALSVLGLRPAESDRSAGSHPAELSVLGLRPAELSVLGLRPAESSDASPSGGPSDDAEDGTAVDS